MEEASVLVRDAALSEMWGDEVILILVSFVLVEVVVLVTLQLLGAEER